jgi:hypothetical protein
MSETNQRSEPSREEEARQLYLQWGGQGRGGKVGFSSVRVWLLGALQGGKPLYMPKRSNGCPKVQWGWGLATHVTHTPHMLHTYFGVCEAYTVKPTPGPAAREALCSAWTNLRY